MFKIISSDYEHELELEGIDAGARFGESWLWVQHTLADTTWQSCYERDSDGNWNFLDGDFGPELPADLEARFCGTDGDGILDRLFEDLF